MKTLLPFSTFLIIIAHTALSQAETNNEALSPDGAYKLQRTTAGTWAIFDNSGNALNAITPRLGKYDKIVTAWSPDSTKVAILAMTLKTSDLYVLGTKNTYTVPSPSLAALKAAAVPHANFQYNPQSYRFQDKGPIFVAWRGPEQLQVRTEFVADLSDTHLGHQDHWLFIIGYGYDLGDEAPPQNLEVLQARQQ